MSMAKSETTAEQIVDEFEELRSRRYSYDQKLLVYYEKLHTYKVLSAKIQAQVRAGVKSDIRIPRIYSHNETKKPRIINNIFSCTPIMRATPYDEESYNTFKTQESVIDKFMQDELYLPFALALHQGLWSGTGWNFMYWDMDDYGESLKFGFSDVFDTYIDDRCLFIPEADAVYRCFLKKRSYFEAREAKGDYKNVKSIPTLEDINVNDTYAHRLKILGFSTQDANSAQKSGSESEEFVFAIEKTTREKIQTVANNKKLIRDSQDIATEGILPFYAIRDYPSDVVFYGMGEIELLKDIPAYQEEIRNLRMDIIRRVAYPATLISNSAMIPPEDLVIKPNQVVHTDDMKGFTEIYKQDVKRSLYEEEYSGNAAEENATGIFGWMKSGIPPRSETATMGLKMEEATMERINSLIFWLAKDYFKRMAHDMSFVLQKKLNEGFWAKFGIEDEKPKKMKKEELKGLCKWELNAFKVRGSSDVALQQVALQIFNNFKDYPTIKRYEFTKKILEFLDFKNYEDFVVPDTVTKIMELIAKDATLSKLMAQAVDNPEILIKVKQLFASAGVNENQNIANRQENIGGNQIMPGSAAVGNMATGEIPATAQMEGALGRELV